MKPCSVLAATMALGLALAATDGQAQQPPQQERYLEVVAEPADGGFLDYDQPGTGITLTKVTKNLFYGLYYGYDQDGRPMWRNFVGTFIPARPVNGKWDTIGTLKAKTYIATGGQVLGQPWREQVEKPAPEGDIEITFHSARKATISYGGSLFNGIFPQVAHAAVVEEGEFGFADGGWDSVEVRLKVAENVSRHRGVIISAPLGLDDEGRLKQSMTVREGDPLFDALCENPENPQGLDVIVRIAYGEMDGRGELGIYGYDPGARAYVLRKKLATLVAARDGIVFHGKTCEGLALEGVILPNRSQMVYFDINND